MGVDFIRVRRIVRAYHRRPDRFLHRIFSGQEIKLLAQKKNLLPAMAARFAAKEAVAKALGCGIGIARWREMEILPGERGKPTVILSGGAKSWAEKCGIKGVEVSMSHDGSYAIAQAVAYGD